MLRFACHFGQSVTESDGEADDYGYYGSEDSHGAGSADELADFDAAGMGEYTPQAVTSGYASEQPVFQEESMEGFPTDGRGFYPSMLVRAALAPHHASLVSRQLNQKKEFAYPRLFRISISMRSTQPAGKMV